MRRLFSILLLAAFALPLVAPLLALAQDPDAGLPACCRRHGKHHCRMLERGQDPSVHQVVPVCPFFPQHQAVFLTRPHPPALQPAPRTPVFVPILAPFAHAETRQRITRARSHSVRGPPPETFAIS